MIDYHMHLERGPLTLSWLREFWSQAQARGIREIAITEHAHRFREFYPVYSHLLSGDDAYPFMKEWMAAEFQLSLADYQSLIAEAQQQGIPVKFGIEVDYFIGREELIRELLDRYPFDFVLGSVHVLGKWGFDISPDCGWAGRSVDEAYGEYISALTRAALSGLFDCLAHLDVIKVFGHRPSRDFTPEWAQLLEAAAAEGVAVEISTAGLRKPVGEIYPAPPLLALAAQRGIAITIASDAHQPQDVGYQWEAAAGLAGAYGYTSVTAFSQRKPYAISL